MPERVQAGLPIGNLTTIPVPLAPKNRSALAPGPPQKNLPAGGGRIDGAEPGRRPLRNVV